VGSLAKLPEEELTAAVVLEPIGNELTPQPDGPHAPHLIDDGVAQAEASDHLDDETDSTSAEEN